MIRWVDEDSNNDKGNNAMVSHNKEEEEGEGGRDAKLAEEMSTTDFRTQDIFKRPIAMCTQLQCINTRQLISAASLYLSSFSRWNMFAAFGIVAGSQSQFIESGLIYRELKSFLVTSEGQMTLIPLVTTKSFQKYFYNLQFVMFCG